MTRRILVGLVGLLAVSAASAAPAGATLRPGIKIVEGTKTTATHPPIPGNYPVAPTVNWTPAGCNATAAAVCDTIPIEILTPQLGPADDFYVSIEVKWNDPQGVNDIDLYMWDDQQIKTRNGTTGWTEVNRAATSANPEVIKMFSPGLGKYNLTVVNFRGPNLGYTVTGSLTVARFEQPFESLAPGFSVTTGPSDPDSFTPFDYSATPPPGAITGAPMPPAFAEIALTPDSSFDFGESNFDQALAAPPQLQTGIRLQRRPPQPVPGAIAVFWFGLVPLGLVGAGAWLLATRRRSSMALA